MYNNSDKKRYTTNQAFLALIPKTAFGIYNNGATTATVNNP